MDVLDFVISGEVGNFAIASIQLRSESMDLTRSPNSIVISLILTVILRLANMIFLGGINVLLSRNAEATFVEASTDVTDNLEIRGALRYESLRSRFYL